MARAVDRPRNIEWKVWQGDDGLYNNDSIQRAILLDIREYLRQLVTIFQCSNAQAIPKILREIQANTTRPKRRKRRG